MGVPVNYNIRNLIERRATSLMTAFGIGLTVAVLVTSMALTEGLKSVFAGTGDPRQLIVLRKGANAELSSSVSNDAYQIIRRMPGIEIGADGEPLVSPEGLAVVNLPSVEAPEGMNVTVRGLLPIGLSMRDVQMIEGKKFDPGLRQVIVGQSVAKRYPDAHVGKVVKFGKGSWEVVGVFKVGDSAANSEIWVDLNQLRGDFEERGGSSSLLVRMTAGEAELYAKDVERVAKLKDEKKPDPESPLVKAIKDDQRLSAGVIGEKGYYAEMTSSGLPLQILGFAVAIIMAVGSAFAATNTMYAAVSRRTREIATLRALGFGRASILRSFLLESVCLALAGGIVGVLIALPVNGLTTGVGSFKTFSEVAFKFRITGATIAWGLGFAAFIGALGGFLPAWSASKKTIVSAMREQ